MPRCDDQLRQDEAACLRNLPDTNSEEYKRCGAAADARYKDCIGANPTPPAGEGEQGEQGPTPG